jgi:4-aminobutyrate aminotransferase/diaminobutyrate-pyruvate transaminase/4-aminobutyrate aminotransferase/(S)-3-amino-2-methylpropionate transaminase
MIDNLDGLLHSCRMQPEACAPLETPWRRIQTALPVPESMELLKRTDQLTPAVNCYQPPIVWDRAAGFQVFDAYGNCWIDFTSTAVAANSGHGHPRIREALAEHVQDGMLAQFSFYSADRVELAERLVQLGPACTEKVYFWTTGSEAIECSFRLARQWGQGISSTKFHLASVANDYHGCTLAAHQLSGETAVKPWNPDDPKHIHRIPFPSEAEQQETSSDLQWDAYVAAAIRQTGVADNDFAGLVLETFQGWGALALPTGYVQALRRWADANQVLIVFDEVQTGFGRTGKWFAHEHFQVNADLVCIGKGLTSSLPLAAILGRADVLDLLSPGEVTTTHAAHPVSCVAALANLDVLEEEDLINQAARKGVIIEQRIERMAERFPDLVRYGRGKGLMYAIHLKDPVGQQPANQASRDLTWEIVKRGVMMFYTNRPTLKVVPPLVISDEALGDGLDGIEEALAGWQDC